MVWFYVWAHNASALVTVEYAIELAGFGVALTGDNQAGAHLWRESSWEWSALIPSSTSWVSCWTVSWRFWWLLCKSTSACKTPFSWTFKVWIWWSQSSMACWAHSVCVHRAWILSGIIRWLPPTGSIGSWDRTKWKSSTNLWANMFDGGCNRGYGTGESRGGVERGWFSGLEGVITGVQRMGVRSDSIVWDVDGLAGSTSNSFIMKLCS